MIKSRNKIYVLPLIIFLASACGGGAEDRLSEENRQATVVVMAQTLVAEQALANQPTATHTPAPATGITESEPTEVVSGPNVIFRDDFNGGLHSDWFWENEIPERWTITDDGWLQITADDFGLTNTFTQNNMLWHGFPTGDFQVITHVVANPSVNFQQAGLFIYGNNQNYVSVIRSFCTVKICKVKGNTVSMEYQINGIWWLSSIRVKDTDIYLKLDYTNGVITAFYAIELGEWIQVGTLDGFYAFDRIGLGASNVDTNGKDSDLVAKFDFFEVTQP